MNLSPFGYIDPNKLQDYFSGILKVGDDRIDIDLNFESESVSKLELVRIGNTIERVSEFIELAWQGISDDWDLGEESETSRFYLQHHLDEFDKAETLAVFGNDTVDKAAFISALSLVRIGLYPEDEDMYAVFDIQFSQEITNYLMSISITQGGQVTSISFES